jgi:hypothetical protein
MRSRLESMGSDLRENAVAWAGAGLGIAIVGWLALSSWQWTDYDSEARPAFDALLSGHLLGFLKLAPAYGGSLALRAPFVALPKLWGGGELSTFRAAAAPCLAASTILGVWLVARMRALGRPALSRALVLFLCVANPITLPALEYGHPEELLGAVLCIAAVLVATRNRPLWAGVLLGLAVANKEWALLAIGPVMIALPEHRLRALLAAGGIAALVLAPFALVGSSGFAAQAKGVSTGHIFNPWQLWWFFGSHAHLVRDIAGHVKVGYRVGPSWIETLAHPLIVAVSLPLTLLCAWLRRRGSRRPANEALLLLALLLLLRFALDPWNISYYALPFLIALLVWETLTFERPPVLALFASAAAWFVSEWGTPIRAVTPDVQSLIFVVLVIPALLALLGALYVPGLSHRLAFRARRRPAVLSPA